MGSCLFCPVIQHYIEPNTVSDVTNSRLVKSPGPAAWDAGSLQRM